jgi:oligopeptide/dipeptide ABC transporter ATP-binding protein
VTPVLEVTDLVKHFRVRSGLGDSTAVVRAVDGVSLRIDRGEVLGLVGESGSGKSTVAKCIMRLIEPTSGTVRLNGTDITGLSRRQFRALRREVHMVFQDPYSSLNPRMTCGQIAEEPLRHHRIGRRVARSERVGDLFEKVGLNPQMRARYPHELSGGQRQRVGLARALAVEPSLLIADEPISALDVSVQASIVNLLLELQQDMGFSCLFVAHDLAAVEFVSDRIAVMYLGKIVETTDRQRLFAEPRMPYTQALLSAVPVPDPVEQRQRERILLPGEMPSPINPPSGCSFRTRCPIAEPQCAEAEPLLAEVDGDAHLAACHLIGPAGEAPKIRSTVERAPPP